MPTLAAGRTGQELRQRDQVGVGLLVEPFAALDEFVVEIAEMRDRAAEARQAETEKGGEHFADAAVARCLLKKSTVSASARSASGLL